AAARLPFFALFDREPILGQPTLPMRELVAVDREGNVQFAIAIVRRGDFERSALLEKQQHLALARAHRATASAEIADHPKTEYLLVEASRYGDVAHVQRRFQNSAILGRHDSTLPEKTGGRRNVPRFSRCGFDGKPGNVPSDPGFSHRNAAAVN